MVIVHFQISAKLISYYVNFALLDCLKVPETCTALWSVTFIFVVAGIGIFLHTERVGNGNTNCGNAGMSRKGIGTTFCPVHLSTLCFRLFMKYCRYSKYTEHDIKIEKVGSDSIPDTFCADTSSLMETGYSLLMDSRSALNAKKLLASWDFQVHIQPVISFGSGSVESQTTIAVILHFVFYNGQVNLYG